MKEMYDGVLAHREQKLPFTVKRRKLCEWQVKNAQRCIDRGVSWLMLKVPDEDTLLRHPGLRLLNSRQMDILLSEGVTFPEREPRASFRTKFFANLIFRFFATDFSGL